MFNVGVTIHFVDQVSAGLAALAQNCARTQQQCAALQAQFQQINAVWQQGQTFIRAGVTLATPLINATEEAGKLQKMMKQVEIATRAGSNELAGFKDQLGDISHATMFSMTDLAEQASKMGQAGIRSMTDIRSLLPQFAASAEVLKNQKGEDPLKTVENLTKMAHQFGMYSAAEMGPIVETVTKLALKLPGGVGSFATMGSYLNAKAFRQYKIDPSEILALEAAAMQVGGGSGGRGRLSGAAIEAALSRIIPGVFGSGLFEGKSAWALNSMGLSTEDGRSTVFNNGRANLTLLFEKLANVEHLAQTAEGRIQLGKMMWASAQTHLSDKQLREMGPWIQSLSSGKASAQTAPAEILERLFKFAFGVTGGGALGMMADPKFQENLRFLQKYLREQDSIQQMQVKLMDAVVPQWNRFFTDMQNVVVQFAYDSLPIIQSVIQFMDEIAVRLYNFEKEHPKITQFVFLMMGAASAALIGGGAFLMLRAGLMAIGVIVPALAPWVWAIVAGITGLVLVIQNWDQILGFLRQNVQAVKNAIATVLITNPLLLLGIKSLVFVMQNWNAIIAGVQKGIISLTLGLAGFFDQLADYASMLGIKLNNPISPEFMQSLIKNSNNFSNSVLDFAGLDVDSALGLKPSALKPPIPQPGSKGQHKQSINVGSINITQQPNQSPKELADEVMKALGDGMRRMGAATTTAGGTFGSPYLAGAE